MATNIHCKNLQISQESRSHIEKKIDKFHRFLPNIGEAHVELVQEKTKSNQDRFVAQITVRADRKYLRAEERNQDLWTAFDIAADKLNSQIVRYKGKKLNRWHAPESIRNIEDFPPISDEIFDSLVEETNREIVRVKQFTTIAMDEEEAIEQMHLLDHDFFVFFNVNTGRINVLYERSDNNYGLLDPVVS